MTTQSEIRNPKSDMEFDRYHRQMLLPGFGPDGQQKLADASALIVGCGALGTVIANMLARAGVGHLIIVDRDFIEMTNLQRQVLFDETDVEAGIPKAIAAQQKIAKVNSQVKVDAIVDDVNHTNIEKLFQKSDTGTIDIVLDGVDNFETRFLVNDCAVKHRVPYVYGGAVSTVGMAYAVLPHSLESDANETPWELAGVATPCLRCVFEQMPPPGMNPTCDTAGVLAPVVSIVANYQCAEALKILTGNWDAISPTMLNLDLWHNRVHQFRVARAYEVGDCQCCKHHNFEYLEGKFGSATTTLCGRNAVQLTHKENDHKLDFNAIADRLAAHGSVKANKFMIRADITDNGEPYEVTLFTDGRAIIKGTKQPSVAKSIYAKYVGA